MQKIYKRNILPVKISQSTVVAGLGIHKIVTDARHGWKLNHKKNFSILSTGKNKKIDLSRYYVTCIYSYITRALLCRLLLYGMLCCLDERYSEAGEFFELATTTNQTSIIAWTIRGTISFK